MERLLRFGRPAHGLVWLEGDWGAHEERRERLLAQAYAALDDAVRLRAARLVPVRGHSATEPP